MSFDQFWDLRWPDIDHERWRAAVEAEVAARGGFPLRIEAAPDHVTCHVELSRAFVEKHDLMVESLSDYATFWITFSIDVTETDPMVPGEPYEPAGFDFEDAIASLRRAGDDLYVLTRNGMCWHKRDKHWHRIDDETWDDRDVDGLGVVGDDIVLLTERGVLDRFGKALTPTLPARLETVIGDRDDLWAVDDDWQGYRSDGTSWRRFGEKGELGRLVRSPRGLLGVRMSADDCRLVRLEDGAMVPHSAPLPEDVIGSWELAVTRDGMCWMNGNASVFRWDGIEWREFSSGVRSPHALIADGDTLLQLGKGGHGARWNGTAMEPFVAAFPDDIRSAEVDPFGVVAIDAWSELVELVPRGPYCYVNICSNTSANRQAWGAATTLIDAIVKRLGGSPGYSF